MLAKTVPTPPSSHTAVSGPTTSTQQIWPVQANLKQRTEQLLMQPRGRALAYVLCVSAAYAPKYVIGSPPPWWHTFAFMGALGLGAWIVSRPSISTPALEEEQASTNLWRMIGMIGLAFAASTAFTVYQFRHFAMWVDSPKFAQALWLVLHGGGIRPVLGMDHPPQTHVTPTLLLLLPWYALVPSHLGLLIVRNALMAAAALPLFATLKRSLPSSIALWLSVAYLTNFTIVYHLTNGYHELHLFPLWFFLACWCLERKWFAGWIGSLFLIGGIREEMGALLLGCAALALVTRAPRRYWIGAAGLGVAWLAFSFEAVLGVSHSRYHYSYVYSGGAHVLHTLLNRANIVYLYQIGLPCVFVLPFLGWFCLPAVPILLGNVYVAYPLAKVAFLQYSIPVACGLLYALARNASQWTLHLRPSARAACLALVTACVLTLSLAQSIEHFSYEKSFHPPLGGGLGVPLVPGSRIATDPQAFQTWMASLRGATSLIPEGCVASVPPHVVAQVPHQRGFLDYTYESLDLLPDYILIDTNARYHDHIPRLQRLDAILARGRYTVEYDQHGVLLYASGRHAQQGACLTGPLTPAHSHT